MNEGFQMFRCIIRPILSLISKCGEAGYEFSILYDVLLFRCMIIIFNGLYLI